MDDPLHESSCRVLSLDGGGAKGFYTLGALKEIEALIGGKLCERFDLVFGTSTGAVIAPSRKYDGATPSASMRTHWRKAAGSHRLAAFGRS